VYSENIPSQSNSISDTFTVQLTGYFPISGQVVNCAGQPVASGYVKRGFQVYLTNGAEFLIPSCTQGEFFLQGYDTSIPDSVRTSSLVPIQVGPDGADAGSIQACSLFLGAVADIEGNNYPTVLIGNQEWMAENLKTSIYLNGDAILTSNGNYLIDVGAWNYYYNNIQNNCPYGKLYNWHAVADPRKVCPTGWHVPSDAEWSTLINHLDPNAGGGSITPNMAGGKLKSTGSQYWNAPNLDATNESGFSGLAGGSRYAGGPYFLGGMNGEFWSSSQSSSDTAWGRTLLYNLGEVSRSSSDKNNAFSVRCIRD
jgi:uncharacterized protein (TIGR02145 family)